MNLNYVIVVVVVIIKNVQELNLKQEKYRCVLMKFTYRDCSSFGLAILGRKRRIRVDTL